MRKTRPQPYILQKRRSQPHILQKTTKGLLCIVDLNLRKGGSVHTVQEKDELAELEVVLLPRPELPPGLRQGHVELHVLDLPIGLAIGLSIGDLLRYDEGPPHSCGATEDSPSTGPPPGDLLQTPHP